MKVDAGQIYGLVMWWLTAAVSVGLLLALSASVAGIYGLRVPGVPQTDPTRLAWLCGAFWLWRGGKL